MAGRKGLSSVEELVGEGPTRHRRRKLLLDVYRQEATKSVTEMSDDPIDIDSSAFDCDLKYRDLLKNFHLKDLVKSEKGLKVKITQLDGNMKTLVYENYSKFIAATDTIREMQTNTDSMEDEMNSLKEKMEKIEEASETINKVIGPRRGRIEELTGISRLLKKREFLFQLPARLERCVEIGALNQTVEYYTKTVGILKKYSHMSSFDAILKECQGIMDRVTVMLRTTVGSISSTSSEAAEAVTMLLKLKYPRSSLWPLFLKSRAAALESALPTPAERDEKKEDQQKMEGKEEEEESQNEEKKKKEEEEEKDIWDEEDMLKFVSDVNMSFLGSFLEMAQTFRQLFVSIEDSSPEDISERGKAEAALEERSKVLFNSFFTLIRNRISDSRNPSEIKGALEIVYRNMKNINAAFSNLGISDKSNAAIRETIHQHIEKNYVRLQRKAESYMREMDLALSEIWEKREKNSGQKALLSDSANGEEEEEGEEREEGEQKKKKKKDMKMKRKSQSVLIGTLNPSSTSILYDIIDAAYQLTLSDIRDFITHLIPFLDYETGMEKEVLGRHKQSVFLKICLRIQQLFLCMNELAWNKAQQAGADPDMRLVRSSYLLCLAQFCATFQTLGIQNVQRLLRELPHEADEPQLHSAALADRLLECTNELLRQYVCSQAMRLSTMIRKTVDTPDWMFTKEPRTVRPVLDMIFDEFEIIDAEIRHVFPKNSLSEEELKRFPMEVHEQATSRVNQKSFGRKLELSICMDRQSILTGITHLFLKSFVEAVRLRTFGRCGYQQMQLDLAFTAAIIGSYIGPGKVGELTDEVLLSVAERCLEPEPLAFAVVEQICRTKLGKTRSAQVLAGFTPKSEQ